MSCDSFLLFHCGAVNRPCSSPASDEFALKDLCRLDGCGEVLIGVQSGFGDGSFVFPF